MYIQIQSIINIFTVNSEQNFKIIIHVGPSHYYNYKVETVSSRAD
jgi:hypothetical protein